MAEVMQCPCCLALLPEKAWEKAQWKWRNPDFEWYYGCKICQQEPWITRARKSWRRVVSARAEVRSWASSFPHLLKTMDAKGRTSLHDKWMGWTRAQKDEAPNVRLDVGHRVLLCAATHLEIPALDSELHEISSYVTAGKLVEALLMNLYELGCFRELYYAMMTYFYAYFEFAKYAKLGTDGLKRLPDMSFQTFEEWAAELCHGQV